MKNIMLIDDDPLFAFIFKETIKNNSFLKLQRIFQEGNEALQFLREHKNNSAALPDILLVDVLMPEKDGWDVMFECNRLIPCFPKKIDVYACSCFFSDEEIHRIKNSITICGYIIKPLSREIITEWEKKYNEGDVMMTA